MDAKQTKPSESYLCWLEGHPARKTLQLKPRVRLSRGKPVNRGLPGQTAVKTLYV